MADKPALFSGSMVRALLREIATPGEGKTQTRRIIEPYANAPFPGSTPSAPAEKIIVAKVASRLGGFMQGPSFLPKYSVGDRIWVRENWRVSRKWDAYKPRELPAKAMSVYFGAGGFICNVDTPDDWRPTAEGDAPEWAGKLRPSMFMPKWASRITLEVTGVKVERLQDCSARDAAAEGVELKQWKTGIYPFFDPGVDADNRKLVNLYRDLWDQINGPGAWDKNPWVAAYTFRPILGNIDQIERAA